MRTAELRGLTALAVAACGHGARRSALVVPPASHSVHVGLCVVHEQRGAAAAQRDGLALEVRHGRELHQQPHAACAQPTRKLLLFSLCTSLEISTKNWEIFP